MKNDSELEKLGPRLTILSAERTMLSWLRLCLTLMGIGFVLDRFGLVLRMNDVKLVASWLPKPFTFWMGTGLVVLGSLTSAAAGFIYARFRLLIGNEEDELPVGNGLLSLLLSALIAVAGVITAVFLIAVTD
ncbi:MAG: DUF202 domain-containing protein [Candidatus Omnitrophica bacterium]|nr:DUF202 domain-containing protein [Candidatus Omnitrophota bacterium]